MDAHTINKKRIDHIILRPTEQSTEMKKKKKRLKRKYFDTHAAKGFLFHAYTTHTKSAWSKAQSLMMKERRAPDDKELIKCTISMYIYIRGIFFSNVRKEILQCPNEKSNSPAFTSIIIIFVAFHIWICRNFQGAFHCDPNDTTTTTTAADSAAFIFFCHIYIYLFP